MYSENFTEIYLIQTFQDQYCHNKRQGLITEQGNRFEIS